MAEFYPTLNDGLINVAHVASVIPNRNGLHYSLLDAEGRNLGTTWVDPEQASGPVVPAIAGTVAAIMSVDDTERPSDVWVEMLPVIAWRINCGVAQPVFYEKPLADSRVLLPLPDGGWAVADDTQYESLDAAKARVLKLAQRAWDDAAAKKAAANAA